VRARALVDPGPVVSIGDDATDVVSRLVRAGWDGLVVVDGTRTVATVSLAQVLRLVLPDYIEDDESLAGVYGEQQAEVFAAALQGHTVADVLPRPPRDPVLVRPDATLLQIAAAMATHACSIVAVVEQGRTLGAIGAHAVLAAASPP
jgi:predicted transcriptional regulator